MCTPFIRTQVAELLHLLQLHCGLRLAVAVDHDPRAQRLSRRERLNLTPNHAPSSVREADQAVRVHFINALPHLSTQDAAEKSASDWLSQATRSAGDWPP